MFRKSLTLGILLTLLSTPIAVLISQQSGLLSLSLMLLLVLICSFVAAWLAQRTVSSGSGSHSKSRPKKSRRPVAETAVDPSTPREQGQVKWFNASKGFGFITRDSGEDVFVHFRSIRGEGHRVLKDGQRVEFSVSDGDKGLQADDVSTL